jgi:uncharacterized protein with NAD-binding domain and iron-sulfur cluster
MGSEKTKVAVLGGGLGSIVSAFELTATPELREKYEVTVYQLGWRIGGKCASGRNADVFERIEEHGLHVWLGFYENAFKVMRDCYDELGREPGMPLATIEEALKPTYAVTLFEEYKDVWTHWDFILPENDETPGTGGVLPTFWDMAWMGLQWAWEFMEELLGLKVKSPALLERLAHIFFEVEEFDWQPAEKPPWWDDLVDELDHEFAAPEHTGEIRSLELAHALARGRSTAPEKYTNPAHHDYLVELLNRYRDWLWNKVVQPHLDDDKRRVYFTMFDTMASVLVGIIDDNLLERGFDAVNDLEFKEWLTKHGARPITLSNCPLIRGWYDLAFCYDNGDINKPDMAAGSTVRALLRLVFTYKGGFFWKMQAGMGDTVLTPFYQVLKRRGVTFKFFHAVTGLGLTADKKSIGTIEIVPQVELAVDAYDPLVEVNNLACWPSAPHWDQLKNGAALKKQGVNFEQQINPLKAKPQTLQKGKAFDLVVLGIPVGALPAICGELTADEENPRFKAMIDNARTVMTQAFQLWASQNAVTGMGLPFNPEAVAGSYVEPVDTFADMSHLLPREAWVEPYKPLNISYICGVLKEKEGETQEEADARVKRAAITYLNWDIDNIWPDAVVSKQDQAFNWDLLVDAQGGHGEERFNSQYWRANLSPSERYVQTPAKLVKYRLRTDESGYDNLFLTGDWIKNGMDAGCVESAVMSGMQASRAICGSPKVVVGEHDDWLQPAPAQEAAVSKTTQVARTAGSEQATYVNYGAMVNSNPPFLCQGTELLGFMVEGDFEKIKALCQQVLSDPAGDAVEYVPLTHWVVLAYADVAAISTTEPPLNHVGSVSEHQVATWIPVAAVKREAGVLVAQRLAWFVPYIIVDNAASLTGGREIYGYPKSFGWFDVIGEEPIEAIKVDVFGGDFGPDEHAGRHRLLELTGVDAAEGLKVNNEWQNMGDAFEEVKKLLWDMEDDQIVVPGLHLAEDLFEDMLKHEILQVFLKQFRSSTESSGACYQNINEVRSQVTRFNGASLLNKYKLTLHELDSHPITKDLGIKSQEAALSYVIKMDFTQGMSEIVWEWKGE